MHQDLLLQLFYHFLSLLFLVSGASILSKSCNLTVIKQSYWIIVVSQNKMDSSSQSQNTQQRPPRAKRLDYHALNTGTDSEGDTDEGPRSRSRSRRRIELNETS
ncbi:hypothetical protein V1522DRAFT_333554, partial [Lipomyces starkeyi]